MGQPISPRGAVLTGLLFAAAGAAIVLAGFGIIPVQPDPDVRGSPWVVVCTGLIFVFGGAAVIVDYAVAGGLGPDGGLLPGTPFAVRVAQYLLGLGIVGMMTAVCSWIAFGPGHRTFSMTIAVPFMARQQQSGETMGRAAFGVAATLLWIVFAGIGFAGARRLIRTRSAALPSSEQR